MNVKRFKVYSGWKSYGITDLLTKILAITFVGGESFFRLHRIYSVKSETALYKVYHILIWKKFQNEYNSQVPQLYISIHTKKLAQVTHT